MGSLPLHLGNGLAFPFSSSTCIQLCLYLVVEVSDLQGVAVATVGEVQTVVTFRGEQTVLEALLGNMTGERLLQKLQRT